MNQFTNTPEASVEIGPKGTVATDTLPIILERFGGLKGVKVQVLSDGKRIVSAFA